MKPCGNPDPHQPHLYVRWDEDTPFLMERPEAAQVTYATEDVAQYLTQENCPGVPEPVDTPPLHGHGGGSHPDACFECWKAVRYGA